MNYDIDLKLGCLTPKWRKPVLLVGWIIRKDAFGEELVARAKRCSVTRTRVCSMHLSYRHSEIEEAKYTLILRYWSQSRLGKFLEGSKTKLSCASAKLATSCDLP
jgi:hypothetical protein